MTVEAKPGRYKARIVAYGAKLTQKGEPAVVVRFAFQDATGANCEMNWQGSLAQGNDPEKSPRKYTVENLRTLGFDIHENRSLAPIADGAASGVLDMENEVYVTVEMDTYNGKTFPKIRFINPIGFVGMIDKKTFIAKTAGMNLEADLALYRQQSPKPVAAAAKPAARQPDFSGVPVPDDIPF